VQEKGSKEDGGVGWVMGGVRWGGKLEGNKDVRRRKARWRGWVKERGRESDKRRQNSQVKVG